MQGPNYPVAEGDKDEKGFFYERRWGIPLAIVVITNLLYIYGIKSILRKGATGDLGFVEAIQDASFLLFSILPFSESHYARLELASSDSGAVMLVVHAHALILFTSGLLLLLMLIKAKDLIRYVANARERGRKELEWMYYRSAGWMSLLIIPCLVLFVMGSTLSSVSKPDLMLDGALLSAAFTPFLVYYGMCAVILVYLSRRPGTAS